MNSLLREYKEKIEKTYSDNMYFAEIYSFLEFLSTTNSINEVSLEKMRNITEEDITKYKKWLYFDKEYCEHKINNKLLSIKTLYTYLLSRKMLTISEVKNIYKCIKLFDVKKNKYINTKDLDEFIRKVLIYSKVEQEKIFYYKMLLYFLFYTGMRTREVKKMRRSGIDISKDMVRLKNRCIPIPKKLSVMIKNYFLIEPEILNAFNWDYKISFFLGKCFKSFETSKGFLSFDLIRESFVNFLFKKGVDVTLAKYLLGVSYGDKILKNYDINFSIEIPEYRNKINKED